MRDTANQIIYVLVAVLVIFGALSFFFAPAYEKGAWLIIGAMVAGLSGMFGFKFGVHVPKPAEGTLSLTKTETPLSDPTTAQSKDSQSIEEIVNEIVPSLKDKTKL